MTEKVKYLFTIVLDMDITEPSGYKDFMWAIHLHQLNFEILGLWPKDDIYEKNNLWSKFRISIILCLIIFVAFVPTINAVIQVWSNMILVIDNLRIALTLLAALLKYVTILRKRTVLLSIINMMAKDWITFKSNTERDMMIKQAQTARLVTVIGYFFMIIGILGAIIPAIFGIQILSVTNHTDQHKALLFLTYDFYDSDKNSFLVLIILHVCGQLENFRCRLINMVSCKNFDRKLNNIVASHLRVIRFADKIENTYSLMMLIMLLHFIIVFCLSGFCLLLEMEDITTKIYFSIIMLTILLINTFLYCAAGELLTEQCNAVYHAICNLEWYKLESRNARNLILLIIRARHPCYITAGKIIPLTVATFSSVLKTSCGYITFLLAKRA
ncbi:odorant receptor 22c-like isoform X2 [Solenopsis invicta]|uniref:odorant receptor 22c-like isoform X2 n=1 Tax=Solenopsis invicta TaxID=13686 RepID=UPI00193E8312|nr:odorant receptor 22c-like isoform X2 [Solenopsis invicta]